MAEMNVQLHYPMWRTLNNHPAFHFLYSISIQIFIVCVVIKDNSPRR